MSLYTVCAYDTSNSLLHDENVVKICIVRNHAVLGMNLADPTIDRMEVDRCVHGLGPVNMDVVEYFQGSIDRDEFVKRYDKILTADSLESTIMRVASLSRERDVAIVGAITQESGLYPYRVHLAKYVASVAEGVELDSRD